MAIKIKLNWKHINGEFLERFENKLRTFLKDELTDGFVIEDSYTGNTLSPEGGKD